MSGCITARERAPPAPTCSSTRRKEVKEFSLFLCFFSIISQLRRTLLWCTQFTLYMNKIRNVPFYIKIESYFLPVKRNMACALTLASTSRFQQIHDITHQSMWSFKRHWRGVCVRVCVCVCVCVCACVWPLSLCIVLHSKPDCSSAVQSNARDLI